MDRTCEEKTLAGRKYLEATSTSKFFGGLGGYTRDVDVEEASKYIWVDTAFWAVYPLPGLNPLLRAVDAQ